MSSTVARTSSALAWTCGPNISMLSNSISTWSLARSTGALFLSVSGSLLAPLPSSFLLFWPSPVGDAFRMVGKIDFRWLLRRPMYEEKRLDT